jgi:DNA-dependent RNA polymerase auxiliary subunit epsilon
MKRFWIICLMGGVSWLLSHGAVYGQPTLGFTQEDRERIIRLETTLTLFMEATDQRFIELREDMNIRFIELREDMNKRFEQADKRFAQVDQRFEDMNNRFEQMMNTLQLIAGIFTVLTLGVIGFAYWDRRTIIRKAKEETLETLAGEAAPKEQATIDRAVAQAVQEIKKDQRLPDLLSALRKLAATDPPLANVLKEFHLL